MKKYCIKFVNDKKYERNTNKNKATIIIFEGN